MSKKVIIIGGVAGGASCAARLRRLDEQAEIIMVERGPYISFANCGLPYHIGGVIEDRDELMLQTPESFKSRFNVDVRVNCEVTKIDRVNQAVTIRHDGLDYQESYDVLVLATGSSPIIPRIPGADHPNILQLWTIADMDKISLLIRQKNVSSAVIVGGGFIGIEMAENLHHAGLDVTLIEKMNQVMPNIDYDMAQKLHQHISEKGVKLSLENSVERFDTVDGKIRVVTEKLDVLADIVILSIGVRPNSSLAQDCGLACNQRGGIIVNEYLMTSDDHIYAVGDAVEIINYISKDRAMIPLAGPANKMGRMAADNICGFNRQYKGTQGSSVAKVFDMTAAGTGLNEKQIKASSKEINRDYRTAILHPGSHAGYYPGGTPIALKIIFDLQGKVLGAQAVGFEGVEKRIDVIAAAMRFGASIYDLEELELCYAPPFSSAKDPVNLAGYVADNLLTGVVDTITYDEMISTGSGMTVLDVREADEVADGAIPGSLHITVDSLREKISTLDQAKAYIVYCAVGIRAYIACRILKQNGFKQVYCLVGGYVTYNLVSQDFTYHG